jgi:hypothetical protein
MDNVTILVLKNGSQIICNLKEVYEGDEENKKGICLLMIHPFLLEMIETFDQENSPGNIQIKFNKWCPYSPDTEFKIPYDSVMAIGSCEPALLDAYNAKISVLTNQDYE